MNKTNFITFPITSKKKPKIAGWQDINKSHKSGVFYGIQCGVRSNLVVVDIDIKNNGLVKWETLRSSHPEFNTVTIATPSGGIHYYFKHIDGLSNTVAVNGYSIDIRTDGGYVCGFDSKGYKITSGTEITTMPQWLFDFVKPKPKQTQTITTNNNDFNQLIWDEVGSDRTIKKSTTNEHGNVLIILDRDQATNCDICDRIHDKDNTELFLVCPKDNKIMYGCTRKSHNFKFLKYIDESIVESKPLVPVGTSIAEFTSVVNREIEKNYKFKIEDIRQDLQKSASQLNQTISFNKQYCSNEQRLIDCKSDIIAIRSPTGSGKTNCVAQMQKNKPTRLLITTFRVGQVPQLLNDKFKHVDGIIAYNALDANDKKFKLDNTQNAIICQAESLHRIHWTDFKNIPTTCVFDEITQFYKQFSSSTFLNQPTVKNSWKRFKQMVRYSDQIVIMDANLSNEIVEWVKGIRGRGTTTVFFNTYTNPKNRVIKATDHIPDIIVAIEKKLMDKKKVYVACNGAISKVNAYAEIMRNAVPKGDPQNKILVIHRETLGDAEVRLALDNLNVKWGTYDGIIVSPSIQAGLSYDTKNVIHSVFGIFGNYTSSSTDCLQMLDRVRHPINNEITISINQNNHSIGPLNQIELIKRLASKTKHMADMRSYLSNVSDYEISDSGNRQFKHNDFFKLFLDNTISRNKDYQNFIHNFLLAERLAGFKIEYFEGMDSELRKVHNKKIKAIIEAQKIDNAKKLAMAISLGDEDIQRISEKIENGKIVSAGEILSLKKNVTLSTYSINENDIMDEKNTDEKNTDLKNDWFLQYGDKKVKYHYRNQKKIFEYTNFNEALEFIKECEINKFANDVNTATEIDAYNGDAAKINDIVTIKAIALLTGNYKYQKWKIALGWLKQLGFDKFNSEKKVTKSDIDKALTVIHDSINPTSFEILDKKKSSMDSFKQMKPDHCKFAKYMLQFINGPLSGEFGISIIKEKIGKNGADKNYIMKNRYLTNTLPKFTLSDNDKVYVPKLINTNIIDVLPDIIDKHDELCPYDSDDDDVDEYVEI